MKLFGFILQSILSLGIFGNICLADILYLKNGNEMEGRIVEETDTSVKLEIFGGKIAVQKTDIERIERKEFIEESVKPKLEPEPHPEMVKEEPKIEAKPDNSANIINAAEFIIYLPSGLKRNKEYPLVVALSPVADAQSMINTWRQASEENKWIIFASKEFRNNIDMDQIMSRLAIILENIFSEFPIDRSKIIATGLSGGGMGAHTFAFSYPELISAVVINTGMMYEHYMEQKERYPKGKIAVFLASPTDFRYEEMKRDRDFLESLGWKTKWIEFKGGHTMAPPSVYGEAAQWLKGQF